jgi:hemerythrin-like domain-containing protein
MKTATENLENDHVYILRLTDVMERMVMTLAMDTTDMEMVVKLIKNYADGYHHAKEENLFFPFMVQKGYSTEHGPVSVMLHEHEEGRRLVREMSDAIALYKAGDELVIPDIYMNMEGYVELLRAHIGKENNVLFKMADKTFSTSDQEHLLTEFAALEANGYGDGQIARFILDIEALEVIYKE